MKAPIHSLPILLLGTLTLQAGSFQNLDFEQGFSGLDTPNAIPSWQSSLPRQNTVCFEAGCGLLVAPGSPFFAYRALEGDYSVLLNSSKGVAGGGSAYLSQAGTIPASAKSVTILVADWEVGFRIDSNYELMPLLPEQGLRLTVNGEEIPLTKVDELEDGITRVGGDIAGYAGLHADVVIRATTSKIPVFPNGDPGIVYGPDGRIVSLTPQLGAVNVGGALDSIEFSSAAIIPEPAPQTLVSLFSMAGLLFGRAGLLFGRIAKKSRNCGSASSCLPQ